MRSPIQLLCVVTISSVAWAGETAPRRAPRSPQSTPLRPVRTVTYSDRDAIAWVNPALCDASGNIFLVTMPEMDPRDVKNLPAAPQHPTRPRDILGIAADGKKKTVFSPAAVPAFADAEQITTINAALDGTGNLYALLWVTRREGPSGQYIASFDGSGRYRSSVEVDEAEMGVHRIAVFGSGEFLLQGTRSSDEPRVAVMSAIGGRLEDVTSVTGEQPARAPGLPSVSDHVARGGDGRLYFIAGSDRRVHAIAPSGFTERLFRLAPVPTSWELRGLMASGARLAVVYGEQGTSRGSGARLWIAVYETTSGEPLATYGPSSEAPVCYEYTGGQDRFTLLGGADLVVVSSP